MQSKELVEQARAVLAAEDFAILSTHSAQHPGYPFGSIVPYAVDTKGRPVILISSMAVHTMNLKADPRCSLLVLERAFVKNPQASGRVTVLGNCAPVSDEEQAAARAAYLQRHPAAEATFAMKDFSLYALEPAHVRFIAGFGAMGWIDGAQMRG